MARCPLKTSLVVGNDVKRVVYMVTDDSKHPAKPLSDAAASHLSERVASRDTSQSKKGSRQQTGTDSTGTGYSSPLSNFAVSHRRCLIDITLELLLTVAAASSLIAAQG